jgi:hypothetical protein
LPFLTPKKPPKLVAFLQLITLPIAGFLHMGLYIYSDFLYNNSKLVEKEMKK